MRNVTLQCVRNIKLSLIMMMALGIINAQSVLAQWTPGWNYPTAGAGSVPHNPNNVEVSIPNTPDAVVLNSAMIDFTNPGAGTPPNHRETVSAIVWGTTNDEIFLFVEHTVRDLSSPNCNPLNKFPATSTNLTPGAQGLHPDVILRDHPNNPGVDYIVSVVYSENGGIYLEEFEITGLVHGGGSTLVISPYVNTYNSQSKTHLTTSTYSVGEYGAYPKIDGFVNPNNIIGDYYEMGGFAVVWETAAGVELQVFDANTAPIYETLIATFNTSYPTLRHTPDVAAIVERNQIGGYDQIACVSFDNANYFLYSPGPDIAVHEYNVSAGGFTPINIYNLSGPTPGNGRSRIDGMGIYSYPNGRWALITNSDCTGGKTFTNTNTTGEYIHGNPSNSIQGYFHSYTITAGSGLIPGGGADPSTKYNDGNIQYPFGMSSWQDNTTFPSDFFLNSINANTGFAYDPTLIENFCLVNDPIPSSASINNNISLFYCNVPIDPYIGHYYTMSTCCNSGFDLMAAWIDDNFAPDVLQYKYTCNGDLNTVTTAPFSPLVGQLNNSILSNAINVYPNPANDYLFIRLDENIEPKLLSVYDVMGRLTEEKALKDNERILGIELKEYATGLYRIDITDTNGKRYGKTIMIK